jgi:hypothetical protein
MAATCVRRTISHRDQEQHNLATAPQPAIAQTRHLRIKARPIELERNNG